MGQATPFDMDAKIKKCLEIARESETRGEMLDYVLGLGVAALALEAWVNADPDQREALIYMARPGVDEDSRWMVALSKTSEGGSCIGKHDDSMAGAIGEALQNWERVHGPDGKAN